MAPAPPNLDTLPVELHRRIASYCDELTVWRIMAISRRVRTGAEMALKPFLKTRTVTVNPPFVVDLFHRIREKFVENRIMRRDALRKRSDRFLEHLTAYPPSLQMLKSATLELRDDCDTAVWPILVRLAPRLESLTVHFYDRLWSMSMVDARDRYSDGAADMARLCANNQDVWRRVLDFNRVRFPALESLILASPCRVLEQLSALANSISGVRSITLSCHTWDDADELGYEPSSLFQEETDGFYHLDYLTLIGDYTMAAIAADILRYTGGGIALTLNFTDFPGEDEDEPDFYRLLSEMGDKGAVRSLAVYGSRTGDFVRDLIEYQANSKRPSSIEQLYLEFNNESEQGEDIEDDSPYTMLSGKWSILPTLPNLRLLTWVDRGSTNRSPPKYKARALQRIFDKYPKLTHVQWMDDYLVNPYTVNSPADGHCGKVIHRVDRPGGVAADLA